jgi:glycosyltransferase involved in cell wall biosynthesis
MLGSPNMRLRRGFGRDTVTRAKWVAIALALALLVGGLVMAGGRPMSAGNDPAHIVPLPPKPSQGGPHPGDAGAVKGGGRATHSASCGAANTHRVDVVVAVPWIDVFTSVPSEWSQVNDPVRVQSEAPHSTLAGMMASFHQMPGCDVCSVTILVPVSPSDDHPDRSKDTGGGVDFSDAVQSATWQQQQRQPVPVNPSMCKATTRKLSVVHIFPSSEQHDDWHRSVFAAVRSIASRASAATTKAYLLYREASVSPVDSQEAWVNSLVLNVQRDDKAVFGCPVFRTAGDDLVHAYAYDPIYSASASVPVLARTLSGYRRLDGPNPNVEPTSTAFTITPVCFAASSVTIADLLAQAAKLDAEVAGTTSPSQKFARMMIVNGALRGAIEATLRSIEIAQKMTDQLLDLGKPTDGPTVAPYHELLQNKKNQLLHQRTQSQEALEAQQSIREQYYNAEALAARIRSGKKGGLSGENPTPVEWFHTYQCTRQMAPLIAMAPQKAPCVHRRGHDTSMCADGALYMMNVSLMYRGTFSHDVPDLANLPTYADMDHLARPAMDMLQDVNQMSRNGSLPLSYRSCANVESDATLEISALVAACQAAHKKFVPALATHLDTITTFLRDATEKSYQATMEFKASCSAARRALPWTRLIGAAYANNLRLRVVPHARVALAAVDAPMDTLDVVIAMTPGPTTASPSASTTTQAPLSITVRYDSLIYDQVIKIAPSLSDPVATLAKNRTRNAGAASDVRLQWALPCCQCCGFSVEAAWIMQGLARYVDVIAPDPPSCHCSGMPQSQYQTMWGIHAKWSDALFRQPNRIVDVANPLAPARRRVSVVVHHWDPVNSKALSVGDPLGVDYFISRSMYEFHAIPKEWIPILNSDKYDEVWVPSDVIFNSFAASGVPASKMQVIPEPIDTDAFNPASARSIALPPMISHPQWLHAEINVGQPLSKLSRNFKFLSIFKFEPRKGWDALIAAYFNTFTSKDPVSLYLVTHWYLEVMPDRVKDQRDPHSIRFELEKYAAQSLGKFNRAELPHVVVITHPLTDDEIRSLYKSCDAFILPSRGEGWGLPIIQAMSMAIPTITTRHSGMLQFTTDATVLYVNVTNQIAPENIRMLYGTPEGASWGEPNQAELQQQLKRAASMSLEERRTLGGRARRHIVENFSLDVIGKLISNRLAIIAAIVKDKWRTREAEWRRVLAEFQAAGAAQEDA